MSPNESCTRRKFSRSIGIQIREPQTQTTIELPRLPVQGCEDSVRVDVGAPAVQAPPSPIKIDVPHPTEKVTLVTTDPGTVGREEMTQDPDQEMLDQLVSGEITEEDVKISNIFDKLDVKEYNQVMDYDGYLPIYAEAIDGRPVEKVVQEIRDILKKKAIDEFNPDEDDLLVEEDPVVDVHMVETRSSTKDVDASKHRSDKDEESAAVDSDSDTSVKLREKDEYILSLERKLEEMMMKVEQMQSQLLQSQQSRPEPLQPTVHTMDEHSRKADSNPKLPEVTSPVSPPEKDIRQMIETQVSEALAHSQGTVSIPKGRPYPEEYDLVHYPKGFVPPSFKVFSGLENPRQHLAHFRASCCNAGGSDALLFRQFVSSLSGIAFEWYADLPNGSMKTFTELEGLFLKRFSGAQQRVTVGDLVIEKQKSDEPLVDYILRWRNLSMKCEP
ncbi:hypothetical protein KFK09_001509 [Dendrobium nobile]|uniref:Retrotransposon gag domain-containing protein n=1 Tax=Dendrobium nobile TaxID=94219 RepID=A0A8T3CB30_DENNO|nr:hypothetical protein KFK09_001509 [Dendrobium nobile]